MCCVQNISHPTNRWLELVCVLFGHDWSSYSKEEDEGRLRRESNQCGRCKLAKRIIYLPTEFPGTRRRVAY